ncbi:MAG: phosphatase PAP2 family protein [Chloroflexi bacterium]|nr:phosphatase PAP2 family protein [Chloroflexota bacterium]
MGLLLGLDARLSQLLWLYGLGWLGAKAQLCQVVLMMALLVLAAMLLVTLIKFTVRRRRPRPPGEFVTFQYDAYSFPSGHAARLAALAVSVMFFDPLLGWGFVGLAIGVAGARIAVGIHYLSDVIIGLGLGALVAWAGLTLLPYLSR